MNIYKSWNHYLKMKRFEKGLTPREVSEKVGISKEYYEKVESGKIRPSISLFQKLYKILELDEVTCVVLLKQDLIKEKGLVMVKEEK